MISYNLKERLVLMDQDVCPISNLLDGDGEETEDITEARVAVFQMASGKWSFVPVNEAGDTRSLSV